MPAAARALESHADARHGHGRGRVVARASPSAPDRTVIEHLHATSPLRFLRPELPGARAANVCVVVFGGGLLAGDHLELELVVEPGATLVVFTQSTTKVFRGASRHDLRAEVHGTLVLLPDPVACCRAADFTQRVDIALHGEGSAIVLDGFTAGRPGYGERWAARAIDLASRVSRDGALVIRDALRLDASDAAIAPRLDPFEALATLIAIGPRIAPVLPGVLARTPPTRDVIAAPSPIASHADAAITRIAATRPQLAIAEARARLGGLHALGVVDPFLARH
jgi:urease accessory protein